MRISMIGTHLWPSLSEMSGWLKSGPMCEVSRWPINNPSPQRGGSQTSKNNKAAAWISCLDSICDPECHLYAFAASIPARPDYHFTPSPRQQSSPSPNRWFWTLDSVQRIDRGVFNQKTKIRRCALFIDQEKRLQPHKHQGRGDVFMFHASSAPLSCSLRTFLSAGTVWILFLQHVSWSCTRKMKI